MYREKEHSQLKGESLHTMKKWLVPVFATFMLATGLGAEENSAEAATQNQLIKTANKYIGTPYIYGGTTTRGFDCSGYTQMVFKNLGITIPRTSKAQYGVGTSVSRANLQTGDLLFFNTSGAGVSHVAIYTGNNKFINAETGSGVTVSSLTESYWNKRYIGAKRVATFTPEQVAQTKTEVKKTAIDFTVVASRGEVALQMVKALGVDTSNTNSPFADVPSDSKYAGAVTALYQLGVFTGDENKKFNLNSPITRAQMAKVLVKAFDLQMVDQTVSFKDVVSTHWSYDYVRILASNGVTTGKADGTYGGLDYVKLTQLNKFLQRAQQVANN